MPTLPHVRPRQSWRRAVVLHARDVAIALIDEVNYEEVLLRDYVMGVGYQE